MVIYAITDRNPTYLKSIYPAPVELVNVPDEIPTGATFIRWEQSFRAYRMNHNRRQIPLGRFQTINEAIFNCRRFK